METHNISFNRTHSYEIFLGNDIFPRIAGKISRMGYSKKCVIITNEIVAKWYLEPITSDFRSRGYEIFSIILPDGEEHKNLNTVQSIYNQFHTFKIDRNSPIVTLGGGVIGDMGGFCAATWLRGIPYIQIPTTLLAMVDASIGGKVGVNLSTSKNLIGAFYQPMLVGIDISVLRTLPLTQLSYGVVEAVKHAMIADPAYFKFIMKNRSEIKNREPALMQRLIRRSLNIKKAIVEKDELDKGSRALLNFGHTFGHALEGLGEYRRYHHGEAVGLGMLMAINLSKRLGKLKEDYSDKLKEFLVDFNLPIKIPLEYSAQDILDKMQSDKKRNKNEINMIIPTYMGSVEKLAVSMDDLPHLLGDVISLMK
ncbi:MAG: 3-dehydroquinate synthase [Candidatus Riflebacteria bacterium]|nr:3-dehydroquinate synthase [Candidatus Riflebacteria bacterium]